MPPRARKNSRPRAKHGKRGLESFTFTLPGGRLGLYVGDQIRDSDPAEVKEGLSRRRILATTGRCPCGAASPFAPAAISPASVIRSVVHAADCPAAEEILSAAMRKADRR